MNISELTQGIESIKSTVIVDKEQATNKYEKLVKESYGDNPCFEDQFISIKILFKFEVPKSYSKKKRSEALAGNLRPTKADIDNYIKSVLDGLNKVAFLDDRYIYSITAEKIFAEESEVIVEISNMKREDLKNG